MKIAKWFGYAVLVGIIGFAALTWVSWKKATDVARSNAGPLPAKSDATPLHSGSTASTIKSSSATNLAYVLPPPSAPLAQLYQSLKSEADAGNPKAACRLGTELIRCRFSFERGNSRKAVAESLANAKPDSAEYHDYKAKLASIDAGLERDKSVCGGFTNPENALGADYLLKAAQGGHLPSQALYAAVPPSLPNEFFSHIDAWAAYKENAPIFLASAADNGHRSSIDQLADEYLGDSFFSPLRLGITRAKPDLVLAAQYSYLAIMAVPSGAAPAKRQLDRLTRIESKLQPDQLAAAKSKAIVTYNSWAKNGEPPRSWELPTSNDRDLDLVCER